MQNLAPCPFRRADDDGNILCERIKTGDRQVSPEICHACPVAAISCAHLRATLNHDARPPIVVRWGNGKTTVLEPDAPSIEIERGACAEKMIAITSPHDCAGCALRVALANAPTIVATKTIGERRRQTTDRKPPINAPTIEQPVQPIAASAQPVADARTATVNQKIIQLQEWLAKQKRVSPQPDQADEPRVASAAVGSRPRREERRVGWTD
jgi:hypothetical protein